MTPTEKEPVLNYDTLVYTMFFLPRRDLFSLMRTCQALYQAGMPLHVERNSTIHTNEIPLSSYFNFLLADPARPRFLKALDLTKTYMDEELGKKVAQVLSQATDHITELRLHGFDICQFIGGAAVSSLRKLNKLVIRGNIPNTDFLKEIQSPISSLSLFLGRSQPYGQVGADPVDLIANFKDTLEALQVSRVCFRRSDIQFPRVHTLRIQYSLVPDLTLLHRCFPNLRKLLLSEDGLDLFGDESIDSTRHHSLSRLQGTWASLDTLVCEVDYAYLLGFRFQQPTRAWHVSALRTRSQDVRRFQTLLGDLQPAQLSVGQISEPEGGGYLDTLENLFPKSSLTHLSFAISFTFLPTGIEPATATNVFLLWASKLELKFLQMRVECYESLPS